MMLCEEERHHTSHVKSAAQNCHVQHFEDRFVNRVRSDTKTKMSENWGLRNYAEQRANLSQQPIVTIAARARTNRRSVK